MKFRLSGIKPIYVAIIIALYVALVMTSLAWGSSTTYFLACAAPFIIAVMYFMVFHLENLYMVLIFTLPLSFNMRDVGLGVGLSLPAEGILAVMGLTVLARFIVEFERYKPYFFHPVSLAIFAQIGWLAFTTLTSTMVLVSFKFLIIRVLFLIVFYFFAIDIFTKRKNLNQFVWLYFVGLIPVIIYTFVMHERWDFSQESSNKICFPFYNDHTIYAACLIMLMPPFLAMLYNGIKEFGVTINSLIIVMAMGILSVAMVFAYSRAGWLSIGGALGAWALLRMRVKPQYIVTGVLVLGSLLWFTRDNLMDSLQSNQTISGGSLSDHFKSTANVSTDLSNTERINRWSCAIRMFKDKPIVGHGPGTYMFRYGAFQLTSEKTYISVSDGSKGGAHSEYLKPLSESGLLGLLTFLAPVLIALWRAVHLMYRTQNFRLRSWLMACILGVLTYLIHGVVNFFLDTDKSSGLYWGMLAMIVAIEFVVNKTEGTPDQAGELETT